jgi:hypothetical protein
MCPDVGKHHLTSGRGPYLLCSRVPGSAIGGSSCPTLPSAVPESWRASTGLHARHRLWVTERAGAGPRHEPRVVVWTRPIEDVAVVLLPNPEFVFEPVSVVELALAAVLWERVKAMPPAAKVAAARMAATDLRVFDRARDWFMVILPLLVVVSRIDGLPLACL